MRKQKVKKSQTCTRKLDTDLIEMYLLLLKLLFVLLKELLVLLLNDQVLQGMRVLRQRCRLCPAQWAVLT